MGPGVPASPPAPRQLAEDPPCQPFHACRELPSPLRLFLPTNGTEGTFMLKLGTALKTSSCLHFRPPGAGLRPGAAGRLIYCSEGIRVSEDNQSFSSQRTRPPFICSHLLRPLLSRVPLGTAFHWISPAPFQSTRWSGASDVDYCMSGREPGVQTEFTPLAAHLNLFWGQGWSPGVQFTAGRSAGGSNLPTVPFTALFSVCKISSCT